MRHVMVRYKLQRERVAENEQLVRDVYKELDRVKPDGLHYATFKLPDGVTFVHFATHHDTDNPLNRIEAFQRFQERIRDRCEDPPAASELQQVGAYQYPGAQS
jgi:hypothetical protein